MPKQTMHRDSRSPPNRAPAQSDPSASRRAETIVPAAGFRTFPQRSQTDARTAPVSIPGQNHTRKSSPSAAPGTPDRSLPRRRFGQGRQRSPRRPMRRSPPPRGGGAPQKKRGRSAAIPRRTPAPPPGPKLRPRPTAPPRPPTPPPPRRGGKGPLKKQNRTIRNYRSASCSRRTNSRTACREKSSPCEVRICPVVGCSSICFSPLS